MSVTTVLGILKQVIKMDLLETVAAAAAAAVGAAAGAAAVTVATSVISGKRGENNGSGNDEEGATQPRSATKDERKKRGRSKHSEKLKERYMRAANRSRVSDSDDACVDSESVEDSDNAGEERKKRCKSRRRDPDEELHTTRRKRHRGKDKDRDGVSTESSPSNAQWPPLLNSMSPTQPQLLSSPLWRRLPPLLPRVSSPRMYPH